MLFFQWEVYFSGKNYYIILLRSSRIFFLLFYLLMYENYSAYVAINRFDQK